MYWKFQTRISVEPDFWLSYEHPGKGCTLGMQWQECSLLGLNLYGDPNNTCGQTVQFASM
jgi:hypothetical protein